VTAQVESAVRSGPAPLKRVDAPAPIKEQVVQAKVTPGPAGEHTVSVPIQFSSAGEVVIKITFKPAA
jgi:hypothetical protein